MNFELVLATAIQKAPLPALASDLLAVDHKVRYPMADILAKVPGDTLAERARTIGVSRQTMYVWAQEKFRPGVDQAKIIAKLTGVPVDHIREYQEGKDDGEGAGKSPRKTAAKLAKAVKRLPHGAARLRAKRTGMAAQQGKRRYARKAVVRNPRGLGGGEGD